MIHFKKMTRRLCGILIIAGCISCSTSTSGGENTENTNENSGNSGGSKENTGNNGGNTQPSQSSKKYTVTYETCFGDVEKITVTENTVLTEKELPVLTEVKYRYDYKDYIYVFDGWYDGDTLAIAGSYKVTKNVTLVAKWIQNYSSVTAELINDDTEIFITAEKNGSLWTLTADEGFTNYVWRIEGEVQTNAESASLEVDTATWAKGLYEVTAEAEKNGAFYSARVYITAGGN